MHPLPPPPRPALQTLHDQMTSIYNVKLSGSAADLYADSVAVLSWAAFDWDGA